MKSLVYSACAGAVLVLLVGCGGGGSGGSAGTDQPVKPDPTPVGPTDPVVTDGPSSDCFNPLLTTAGTTYQLNYTAVNEAGETVDTRSVTGAVKGDQTFIWNNSGSSIPGLTEVQERSSWLTENFPIVSKRYLSANGQLVTHYGSIELVSTKIEDFQIDSTDRKKWTPSIVDGRFLLAKDQSETWNWAETINTENFSSQTQETGFTSPDAPIPRSIKFTYLGQETIVIPAGKFTACKFSKEMLGRTTYEWLGKTNGAVLKFSGQSNEGVDFVASLKSDSRLNGKPL